MQSEGIGLGKSLAEENNTSQIIMLEGLFLAVAGAVFSYVIEKFEPAEQIKKWLKREPSTLAFQKALSRAYTAFARQYPEYVASLFDKSFLTGVGAPELAKLLTRHLHPDPALFAQAWGISIGFDTHSPFCKEATKPAADFLKWLEAELKSETVFQSIFDSRALESLPQLETQIEKLTTELKRGLEAALKAANDYEKITLEIGGDVGGNIVIGDNNQVSVSNVYNHYHTGEFATLNDYYIAPDAVFQRVRVDEFVGRDWLTAKVDFFLNDLHNKSGIFLLVGEAGVGKTSFMAHLVKERRYLHLFAEQIPGDANLQRALQSLGSQLVTRYQIETYKDRDTLTQLAAFPDFLDKLLRLAVHTLTKDEKIVIVCDALDEAGTAPDGNVFGLPNVLPDNVYFILSQRPISTKLPNVNTQTGTLEAQGSENLQDMDDYLKAVMKRPEVAGQLRSKNYSEQFFVQTLKEKSLGVWMYLHYIIEEIKKGSRAPLEFESLPTGLVGYYADYWNDWREGRNGRGESIQKWDELYAPLLTTLAATQEPIRVEQLIAWAGIHSSKREVTRLLNESWRSFLTIRQLETGIFYSPYHASFRDFLTGKADLSLLRPAERYLAQELAEQIQESHERIVNVFRDECDGNWPALVDQDYLRLHLTTHLAEANEYKTLVNLLTEGKENIAWAEVRYRREETYAGFLSDLEHVWKYAQANNNMSLQIRCMLIENSIRSLAGKLPAHLIAELGKTGIWSYVRCVVIIGQIPDSGKQAEAISQIVSDIPKTIHEQTLTIAREIKNESARAAAFAALTPHLDEKLKVRLLNAAREVHDETARADALSALAPHLNQELNGQVLEEALAAARGIHDESDRARAFAALTPHLDEELKAQVLEEALAATREIKSESARARAFTAIAPYLNQELNVLLLAAAREIHDETARADALSALAPHLNEELKAQVLEEALAATREIKNESARARAFAALAPHLNEEFKAQVLEEALATAREIHDEHARAYFLSALASHVNEELKAQVLEEALAATREIKSEHARAYTLSALALHLNQELNMLLLAAAREIKNETARADALSALAPHLNQELEAQVLEEALAAAREIHDETARADAFAALTPHLDEELKVVLLAAAREIKNESARADAFAKLAPHLNEALKAQALDEALAAAREIKNESARADAFAKLAPHLNEALKAQVLEEALAAAREIHAAALGIHDESDRARAFAALTPHLNEELKAQVLEEALAAAREIKYEYARVRAFTAIAPYLNQELKAQVLEEALAAARGIHDEFARARAFAALAPHLDEELKVVLLAAAREIKNEYDRERAFTAIAPYFNQELNVLLLAAAREIHDEFTRADAISALAPHLNQELKAQVLEEALSVAREISQEFYRGRVFSKIAFASEASIELSLLQEVLLMEVYGDDFEKVVLAWEKIQFRGLLASLNRFFKTTAHAFRNIAVSRLTILMPAIVHFEGKEISGEILRAVIDTARWWP